MPPIVRGRCDVCGDLRNLWVSELAPGTVRVCSHRASKCCPGTMVIVYAGSQASMPTELAGLEPCLCNRKVTVVVSGLSGEIWSIEASPVWSIRTVKGCLSELTSIPWQEMRLLSGTTEMSNEPLLLRSALLPEIGAASSSIVTGPVVVQLTLVRRPQEQAKWLTKIDERPAAAASLLQSAPKNIRGDREVVLAAFGHDAAALHHAAPELLSSSKAFVVEAMRLRLRLDPAAGIPESADWAKTTADVLLALYLAGHLALASLASSALKQLESTEDPRDKKLVLILPALAFASVRLQEAEGPLDQSYDQADSPAAPLLSAMETWQGLTKEVLQTALVRPVLESLPVGTRLLELIEGAPERMVSARFWDGMRGRQLLNEGEGLDPGTFAMELFLRHSAAFSQNSERKLFGRLLQHLRQAPIPNMSVCKKLVQASVTQGHGPMACDFFRRGADGSDESAALLDSTGLPLTVLKEHPHRTRLLGLALSSWGSAHEVVAGISQDRNSVRKLLRQSEGDVHIGRVREVEEALNAAVECGDQRAGRALLRAFASPEPQTLPGGCEVPLAWLEELRDIRGCSGLAVERILQALESVGGEPAEDAHEALTALAAEVWPLANWGAASDAQVRRAARQLRRWGFCCALSGGQEVEARLEQQACLCRAIATLPLEKLELVERREFLLAPELPAQATAMLALEAAGRAEEATVQLKRELAAARQATEEVRREAARNADSLRSEIRELERRLEAKMRALP
ncbi:unnamed protein product [Polarella glacialis]|uniref:Ubiquitin-like domain-containing protein n=1 Tax=Polarella glacialis TaxID=89957 RepID=A0A813LYS7_POLGL|nr:unnamed protein product [Polarella glacialis]